MWQGVEVVGGQWRDGERQGLEGKCAGGGRGRPVKRVSQSTLSLSQGLVRPAD